MIFLVFVILTAIILVLMALVSYFCYRLAFAVTKKQKETVLPLPDHEQYNPYKAVATELFEKTKMLSYEEVFTESFDGLRLCGKYYHLKNGAPLMIMMHGYRSTAERDFCGGLLTAIDMGFNVLTVDQRAHGKSDGKCITFGIKERYDCKSWVEYALNRFGSETEIVLFGMSMGAATVLMATELSLSERVIAVVADCGYSSPSEIIKKVIKEKNYPTKITYFFVRLGALLYGGFDPQKASPVGAMEKCNLPVLFIHGSDDRFVPVEMAKENYSRCVSGHKKMLIVEGAGHGMSFLVDNEQYMTVLENFLKMRFN